VQAHGVVSSIMAGLAERHPTTNALKSASVEPYYPTGARRRRDTLGEASILAGAGGVVLVVVCLNMSGMVLVRSATRERELAVRLAIGASRWRLMQYLLSESVVLALLGGALGAAVLFGVPMAVAVWAGTEFDEFGQMTLDAPIVAAGVGLCLAASLVFGLLPAIRFSRPKVMAALKDEAGGGGRRVGRIHRWTVAVQVGLAVPFLVVCGVQLDQFHKSALADLGFDPAGLFAVPLDLSASTRADGNAAFVLRTVQSQLEQASGVSSVSVANGLPLDAQPRITRVVRDGAPAAIRVRTVTRVLPGYFETMGVRIARGRGISAGDRAGSEPVVLISQALASRLFPDEEPVGQRLTFALDGAQAPLEGRWEQRSAPGLAQTFTVIGVTEDLVDAWLGPPQRRPQLFVPLAQHPATYVYVIARSAAALQTMTAAVERSVTGLYADPDVIGSSIVTGERLVRRSRSELVMGSAMSAIAAGAALLLAALGVFGVVGFMVATRTREIGIRIALGATRSRVVRGVLVDAVKVAVWGVVVGLAIAVLWEREMSWSSIGGVESLVYASAVGIALGVALLASLPAARRAAAIEPIIAMRAE
jgi:predicted permease